jgi:hypothetical protein
VEGSHHCLGDGRAKVGRHLRHLGPGVNAEDGRVSFRRIEVEDGLGIDAHSDQEKSPVLDGFPPATARHREAGDDNQEYGATNHLAIRLETTKSDG